MSKRPEYDVYANDVEYVTDDDCYQIQLEPWSLDDFSDLIDLHEVLQEVVESKL